MLGEVAQACRIFNSVAVGVVAVFTIVYVVGEVIYDVKYKWMDWKAAVTYAFVLVALLTILASGILGSGILEAMR